MYMCTLAIHFSILRITQFSGISQENSHDLRKRECLNCVDKPNEGFSLYTIAININFALNIPRDRSKYLHALSYLILYNDTKR